MEEAKQERADALSMLEEHIFELSNVFRESYLRSGRGALIVYTYLLNEGHRPTSIDYNSRKQSLDLFDTASSKSQLEKMIDGYNPSSEGVQIF